MRRLLDAPAELDTSARKLVELLHDAAPFKPNPFVKRMVLQRVLRAPLAKAAFALPAFVAPAAWAALGGVGISVAAYRWVESERPAPLAPPVSAAAAAKPLQSPAPAQGAPVAAEAPAGPPARALETGVPVAPPKREVRAREAKAKLADGEDPSQVLEAVRAMRKDGDPARAQQLLDRYLETQPSGALTEDALALAIEAAAARHDPRAADYARRYLARFPRGRFRTVALRAVGR